MPYKLKTIATKVIVFLLSLALTGCGLSLRPQANQGGLQISVESPSRLHIYVNQQFVGENKVKLDKLVAGQHQVGLKVPSSNNWLWHRQVPVFGGSYTFAQIDATSFEHISSAIVYLEPNTVGSDSGIQITSIPNQVIVTIGDQISAITPYQNPQLPAGEYPVNISAPGYQEISLPVMAQAKHQVRILAELAPIPLQVEAPITTAPEATEPARISDEDVFFGQTNSDGYFYGYPSLESAEASNSSQTYVQIQPVTPGFNWVRVRSTPNGLADNEVARIQVDQWYPHRDNTSGQWIEIGFAPERWGWVSAQSVSDQ